MFRTLLAMSLLVVAILPAQGFVETFDGYQVGTTLSGPWSLMGSSPGIVNASATAFSGSHVLAFGPISLGLFGGPPWGQFRAFTPAPTCGQWRLEAAVRVQDPGTDTLVRISSGDPNSLFVSWALTLAFDWSSSEVRVNSSATQAPLAVTLPPVPAGTAFSSWVQIRVDVDLDADTYSLALNGTPASSGTYVTSGPLAMTGVHLRSIQPVQRYVHWDDVSLQALSPLPYERNKPAATLTLDGVQTCGQAPAAITRNTTDWVTLSIGGSPSGGLSELLVALAPLVPLGAPGSLTLGDGQVVNCDLSHPTFNFANGGAAPTFLPFLVGSLPVQLTNIPPGATISSQLVVLDATSPELISLSQGVQLDVLAAP